MIDPQVIIFAVQSGIKLGKKINQVLIDKTQERALIFPVGDFLGSATENDAFLYFKEKRPELIAQGGPYQGLPPAEQLKAYKTIMLLNERLGDQGEVSGETIKIIEGLHRFEQTKNQSAPAVQQVLGTVVEIGIDYFVANPGLLDGDSNAKQILRSFVTHLDEISFSDSPPRKLVQDVLLASLRTLNDNVSLVDDDKRLETLLGGITSSLIEDYEKLTASSAKDRRERLIKRIASSVIRGGAKAFSENIDLFIEGDSTPKALVKSTLSQLVAGIDGRENLFTNESLELIYKSALGAVSENADLFTTDNLLKALIENTVSALSKDSVSAVFSKETAGAILQGGLEAVRENIETLINPDNPQKELLGNTVKALASGLSATLAGGGAAKDLLSKRQLVELAQIAFREVARSPELLLANIGNNDRRTALAQIIGSLANALGNDPRKLITGEGFLKLVHSAIGTAVLNADKLLNLDTTNVRTNVLFQIVKQAADAVLQHADQRNLVTRDVFLEIVQRSLPVVSANLDGLLDRNSNPVKDAITTALDLASNTLQNRVNGANLPQLIQEFLKRVLRGDLNLAESTAVTSAATEILNAA